jgi:hypothetical protein
MTNENVKIEDNFLKHEEFSMLQEIMMKNNFHWFFSYRYYALLETEDSPHAPAQTHEDELDKFQFIHTFYEDGAPSSAFLKILNPILEILLPISIWRIKANLLTRLPNIVENPFHSDMNSNLSEEKQKEWTTSIFYVNTNDGYTLFEDGTKVESVANRMLTFPADMKHTGTSCTDQQSRVLINFDYMSGVLAYFQSEAISQQDFDTKTNNPTEYKDKL